ncbi:glutamate--tRNA ligase [Striga asiatica]|uniref:Glutamate--tRNA ligase n=1 Tax=Striga asiatica TaxID=4170 RepID=A0A5A7QQS4_STRAF|nr:glutamate--tRNA ligase [Striga asiatica]
MKDQMRVCRSYATASGERRLRDALPRYFGTDSESPSRVNEVEKKVLLGPELTSARQVLYEDRTRGYEDAKGEEGRRRVDERSPGEKEPEGRKRKLLSRPPLGPNGLRPSIARESFNTSILKPLSRKWNKSKNSILLHTAPSAVE